VDLIRILEHKGANYRNRNIRNHSFSSTIPEKQPILITWLSGLNPNYAFEFRSEGWDKKYVGSLLIGYILICLYCSPILHQRCRAGGAVRLDAANAKSRPTFREPRIVATHLGDAKSDIMKYTC
jgi:hypothetical protein